MRWDVAEINFNKINIDSIKDNQKLFFLLACASYVESGSALFTSNLKNYLNHDNEICTWLSTHWEPEELQHGRALQAYINYVWPEFNWEKGFKAFLAEYTPICKMETFEKTPALEMLARCVVETATATLYQSIFNCAEEPILKQIAMNIKKDEIHHFKHFYRYFKKYNIQEKNGFFRLFFISFKRLYAINDDIRCFKHVYLTRFPQRVYDKREYDEMNNQVFAMMQAHLATNLGIKMFLKPLALPKRVEYFLFAIFEKFFKGKRFNRLVRISLRKTSNQLKT